MWAVAFLITASSIFLGFAVPLFSVGSGVCYAVSSFSLRKGIYFILEMQLSLIISSSTKLPPLFFF